VRLRRELPAGAGFEVTPLTNAEPRPGDVVDGRFAILEAIGHGGMASVFKATDVLTGDPVALKIPFAALERDSVFRERFLREIEIGRVLNHPAIIRIVPVDRPSRLYLPMEFVEGQTLWDRMRHERPLPVDEALCIARQLCDALEHMEQHQVFHRDVKPTNVMLGPDGSLRIMDFGVAMTAASRRLTLAGAKGIGTPEYMAPEQVQGRRGDHRADIYSVGAILYEMTTGSRPYDEQPDLDRQHRARLVGDPVAPRVHNPSLSPAVEEIILHALARDPNDRYRSAADLRADLQCPDQVVLTGRAHRLRPVKLRSQAWTVAWFVVAALTAPVLLFFLLLQLVRR
jgi:serine/threonine-protein kinase